MLSNRGGLVRAMREFEWFTFGTVIVFGAFVAAAQLSQYPGARNNVVALGTLAAFGAIVIAYAYLTTLARTPRSTRFTGDEWTVLERNGRVRSFPRDVAEHPVSLRVHPPDIFSILWTETVEIQQLPKRPRVYLVERGLRPGSEKLPTQLAERR